METNQVQNDSGQNGQEGVNASVENTVEVLQKKLDDQISINEQLRSAQSGVDRANTDLRKELEDLRKSLQEKMSDNEKKVYEQQLKDQELEDLKKRVIESENKEKAREFKELKLKILKDNDLNDIDLIDILGGDTVESFTKTVKEYKEKMSKYENDIKSKIVNGSTPESGNTNNTKNEMTRKEYESLDPYEQAQIKDIKIVDK